MFDDCLLMNLVYSLCIDDDERTNMDDDADTTCAYISGSNASPTPRALTNQDLGNSPQ